MAISIASQCDGVVQRPWFCDAILQQILILCMLHIITYVQALLACAYVFMPIIALNYIFLLYIASESPSILC
jgi:hypothetical protein